VCYNKDNKKKKEVIRMYELTWKEILENDNYSLVSMKTGEIFDNIEQAIN
jgi:hypothetical protein